MKIAVFRCCEAPTLGFTQFKTPGFFLACDEFGDCIRGHARIDNDHGWRPHHPPDHDEAVLVPLDRGLHARVGDHARPKERPGVPVGLSARDLRPGQVAVGTGLRLDHDPLPPIGCKLIAHDPRHDVDDAAGRIWQDDVDASVRKIRLGVRRCRCSKRRKH